MRQALDYVIQSSVTFNWNKAEQVEQELEQTLQSKGITMPNYCRQCGEQVALKRWELGYKFCLSCGDEVAKKVVR